jgi:hypothetical protein
MSALSIQPTFPTFADVNGQPLDNGYIWLGTANLDPQTNPITVYWDAALTMPASQPIRTLAGYPSNNGAPARVYVDSDYSIRVMNKNGSTIYSAPAATERYSDVVVPLGASDIKYTPAGPNAVATTVEVKLLQTVSVFDYFSSAQIADVQAGTCTLDTSAAINALISYVCANGDAADSDIRTIEFPPGVYRLDNPIDLTTDATHFHSRLILRGSGWRTVLQGRTGKQVIDFGGSFQNKIENLFLSFGGATPSTIGVLFQRGAYTGQCINHKLDNIYMDMGSSTTANNGVGTVGIWNCEGENANYHNVFIRANRPAVLSKYPVDLPYVPTSYVTLKTDAPISCGSIVWSGQNTLVAWDFRSPPLWLDGTTHLDMGATYLNSEPSPYGVAAGTNTFGVRAKNVGQMTHFALVEVIGQYMKLDGFLISPNLNIQVAQLGFTTPIIDMTPPVGGSTAIIGGQITVLNNEPSRRFAIWSDKNNGTSPITAKVTGTQIVGYGTYAYLPKALAFNSDSYQISNDEQILLAGKRQFTQDIPVRNITLGGDDGVTPPVPQTIASISLPVAGGGDTAGSIAITIDGVISTAEELDNVNAPAQLQFRTTLGTGSTNAAALTVGTPSTTVLATYAPNPAIAEITGVTITAAIVGTSVVIYAVFSVLGTNTLDYGAYFEGTINIKYFGYRNEAPLITV